MPATPIGNPASGESLLGTEPQLLQQVDPGWRRRLNLFTGRALSDTALDSEQAYRAGLLATLGQSVTPGIVKGLTLTLGGSAEDPVLNVTAGYGIAASGEDVLLLRTMQTRLSTIAVVDPATGTLQQTFNAFAANPGNGIPAGILLLQPIVAQVNGQMLDTGSGPIEVSGNLNASCDQDPDEYAFEDWQIADGVRLVFFPWPLGIANLQLPSSSPEETWRNRLAYTIFDAEAQMAADDQFPWAMLGVPLALAAFEPTGRLIWKASTAFAAGQLITDPNGNLQQVQAGGTSGAAAPSWNANPGQTTSDGTVTWINAGTGTWKANTAYVVGQLVFDPQGNFQAVQVAGKSGGVQPLWNVTSGQTTLDGTVTWNNRGKGNWQKANAYALNQFIVDPNGNVQTVQTAGTSGGTQPVWDTTPGQKTQDGGVTWINGGIAWKLLFVDRSSVVRAGGLPRKRYVLPAEPQVAQSWQANYAYALGQFILDANGNIQKVQTVGTSGGSQPTWNATSGQTTTDGKVTWINNGSGHWQANTAYSAGQIIYDESGNIQIVQVAGTSGNSEPSWNATFLATTDGTVTWINNGSTEPLIVQPALAQARVAQLSEQISDLLNQSQPFNNLSDISTLLPPSGVLPAVAVDFANKASVWLPRNWSLSAAPVHLEELEGVLQTGMTAEPIEAGATTPDDPAQGEEVEILVPLPDEVYDPDILVTELVSPEFQHEIDKATQSRNDTLRQRKAVALQLNALNTVSGPNVPPPNPNLIDPSDGLTPSEISGRDLLPPYFPQPNSGQTFGVSNPASWQANSNYMAGQFIFDFNGNIQVVKTAGKSGATQPAWNVTPGQNTTDGAVTWFNNGNGSWQAGAVYAAGQFIFDVNGSIQVVLQPGTSGKSQYIWNPTSGQKTTDGNISWLNSGPGIWQPNHLYTVGQVVLDSNGNIQVVQTAGQSANSQPVWDTDKGQATVDGTIFWINRDKPTFWEPNTAYSQGEFITDSNNNLQVAQTAGTSGITQLVWNQNIGQPTSDGGMTWANKGQGSWQPGTPYAAGQFIFDSNGNIQTVQTAGTSGSSQPTWNQDFGQTTSDGGVTWVVQAWQSTDLVNLQNAANAAPYTVTYKDASGNQQTLPLINANDWSDLANYGLPHFINRLNAQIKKANDLIDIAFLTSQTDIYRFRQNVLGATDASRLATSPVLANIATGDTATATAANLRNYFNSINPPSTPSAPSTPAPTAPSAPTGAAPAPPTGVTATPFQIKAFSPQVRSASSLLSTTAVSKVSAVTVTPVTQIASIQAVPITQISTVEPIKTSAPLSSAALSSISVAPSSLIKASAVNLVVQNPGSNAPVSTTDIQAQAPIVGAQLDIRTLTVAERLAQSPSQEAMFYAVGNRLGFMQLLQALSADDIAIDDLQFLVDTPPPTTTSAAPVAIPTEIHLVSELRNPAISAAVFTKIQTPYVPADSDEASLFSAGVRVVEQHTQLLRLLEARVQVYVDFVNLCTAALNNIQSDIQAAQMRLKQLDNDLLQARQDLSFTASLLADEMQRVAAVNAQRLQVLQTSVQVIAYTRGRTLETEQAVPSRQLVPGNITNPVPACLQQSVAIPPELREITSLLREAPVSWLPSVQSLLNRLERPSLLQELAVSTQARAAFQLQMPIHESSATTSPGVYGPVISNIYTANQQAFRAYQAQRSTFQPAQIANQSWSLQIASLANIAAIADLTSSAAVHAEVVNATSRIIQQVSSVATCLYVRVSGTLPVDRLAWAEFLRGPGLTIQLQSLTALPNWNTQAYTDRQQMQMLVDWLFQQINNSNSAAMAFMSDVVRVCILLASHAPVSDVIAGEITVRTQPSVGKTVTLNLPSIRVASGMFVQLYSKGDLAAEAVVSDLDSTTVTATVTTVHKPGVFLEANEVAHFTTQPPRAAALKAFSM